MKRPGTEPSGWAFEYANEFYPDIDDTAMVMLALSQARGSDAAAQKACRRRALDWLLAMQSRDGGWAAFDADNNWEFLSKVPFADHNAMLDPTCADITGRVLEALAAQGVGRDHRAVRRGVDWLVRHQEADGSWYGRWGVAYIYGTCFALRGLAACGRKRPRSPRPARRRMAALHPERRRRMGRKLRQLRQRNLHRRRRSTPSQTAWAILGLIAGGDDCSLSVRTASNICWKPSAPMEAGTRNWPPAPASPRFST